MRLLGFELNVYERVLEKLRLSNSEEYTLLWCFLNRLKKKNHFSGRLQLTLLLSSVLVWGHLIRTPHSTPYPSPKLLPSESSSRPPGPRSDPGNINTPNTLVLRVSTCLKYCKIRFEKFNSHPFDFEVIRSVRSVQHLRTDLSLGYRRYVWREERRTTNTMYPRFLLKFV